MNPQQQQGENLRSCKIYFWLHYACNVVHLCVVQRMNNRLNLKHSITAGLKFHQLFLHVWQLCCIFNFYVHSFELFVKLFLVMAIDWLFLLLSWLPYPVLMYCHIVMNALLALAFLYICILSQRQVTLLLRQACCCCQPSEPVNTVEWGEEMTCNVSKSHSAFKILLTAHPLTQHVIPEDLNFLNHTTTML